MWWNGYAHMYKVCSQLFQGHGTWFLFCSEKERTKLLFHPSQKVILARVKFVHIFKICHWIRNSPGKNLLKLVIIGQVAKKKFDNVGQCS